MKSLVRYSVCSDCTCLDDVFCAFKTHVSSLRTKQLVDWKYRDNVDGFPIVVLASDYTGRLVGQQAFMPRKIVWNGTFIDSVQAVDAIVLPEFRRKGIYQELWKISRDILKDRQLFLTGFATTDGMSIGALVKEGLTLLGSMSLLFYPIRPARLATRRALRDYSLDSIVLDVLDRALRLPWITGRTDAVASRTLRIENDVILESSLAHGSRSKEYLNWRYADASHVEFVLLNIYIDGRVVGFCSVKICANGEAVMYDFYSCQDVRGCILAVLRYCRDMLPSIDYVLMYLLEKSVFLKDFFRCGFFPLKSNLRFFMGGSPAQAVTNKCDEWHVTIGDSDW